jgi:DNA-binding NtrC family response regulator
MSTKIAQYRPLVRESERVCDDEGGISWSLKERLAGQTRWAQRARAAVAVHATHDRPLVIVGEPGTGRKFVARLIHERSMRRRGPFLSVACDQS